jgi:hypothetical protein
VVTLLMAVSAQCAWGISINEIRIDQFGGNDPDEYFELEGSPGESLDGLSYLVIGDPSGTGSGVIEQIISLDGRFIGDDGFFLATKSTFGAPGTAFEGIVTDMTVNLNFENSDNVTHLLVNGLDEMTVNGENLDLDDNGTLDVTPWSGVIDAIGLVESPDLSAAGSEWYYGAHLGFVDIGPDMAGGFAFVPGHVYRENNGGSQFVIGEFSLDVSDPNITIDDTPGSSNSGGNSGTDGDFDDNGVYECLDVDSLVAEIVAATNNSDFDLNGDGTVDDNDLAAWLAEAGSTGGLTASGNPVLPGDANLDGSVNGQDFVAWNTHKFTSVPSWCSGDFNADGEVNGPDFVIWNNHKFQTADARAIVPEPCGLLLVGMGLCVLGIGRRQ